MYVLLINQLIPNKIFFKVMEFDAQNHMIIFLCIDYTIWPGWNHRGVYILSRQTELKVSEYI